jgi:hypothetical protein
VLFLQPQILFEQPDALVAFLKGLTALLLIQHRLMSLRLIEGLFGNHCPVL